MTPAEWRAHLDRTFKELALQRDKMTMQIRNMDNTLKRIRSQIKDLTKEESNERDSEQPEG